VSEILLIGSLFKDNKIHQLDMVECFNCEYTCLVSLCPSEVVQDSYEESPYTIHYCPSCGEVIEEYFPSEDWLRKYSKEVYGCTYEELIKEEEEE